jgi:metal-responsive CopG/Arc/MetJ family transcriptional regulator
VLASYAITLYNIVEVITMPATGNKNDTVRYTVVLPKKHVSELKEMVRETQIPSVNGGIRLAIEDFIKAQNKLIYEQKMREAAKDDDYMNRIAETEADFSLVDDEEMSSW